MVYYCSISPEKRALGVYLKKEQNASFRVIGKRCGISKSSAHRLCRDITLPRKKKNEGVRMGRPRKIRDRHMRSIIRTVKN